MSRTPRPPGTGTPVPGDVARPTATGSTGAPTTSGPAASASGPVRPGPPRVLRRRSGTIVAGVAGGLADHLEVDVLRVRLALVLLAALGGAGVLAYGALWVVCAQEPRGVDRAVGPRERQQGLGMAVLAVGLWVGLSALGDQVLGWVVGPLGVALIGAAVVWREADAAERERWRVGLLGARGRAGLARLLVGGLLVAGGIAAFLLGRLDLSRVQFGLLAALATFGGVVVLTIPWWLRLVRELAAERRARIRGQERAEIAAHLHDSVLQTLALIQRQSGEDAAGREVRRLARRQERELRTWLYGGDARGPASEPAGAGRTVAALVAVAAAEVEDTHGVRVAPVVVGDAALDDHTAALVAAAREAMVNAAKHSGAHEVSVYAEVDDDAVEVFVRDRGCGFDPDVVPGDRQGLAGSVRARMMRHGGEVRVRTAPGDGTEVALRMPRPVPAGSVSASFVPVGPAPVGPAPVGPAPVGPVPPRPLDEEDR